MSREIIPFIYEIFGFSPPSEDRQVSGWGFGVSLERSFAVKALQTKITEEQHDRIQKGGLETIKRIAQFKRLNFIHNPYSFVDKDGDLTLLLKFVQVPGNACDLGLEYDEINELEEEIKDSELSKLAEAYRIPLRYSPHNVDSPIQAYTLLSLWLIWANAVRQL